MAVAFLMFIFSVGLNDTDERNNYADNCYNNTNDAHKNFQHQIMYLSLYFPSVSPPEIQEVLKMQTFWRKANHYPFK